MIASKKRLNDSASDIWDKFQEFFWERKLLFYLTRYSSLAVKVPGNLKKSRYYKNKIK